MARLSAARRKKIPTSKFAIKRSRKYPIDTRRRAAKALGFVGMHGTAAQKRQVQSAVARKYPGMVKTSPTLKGFGRRRAKTTRRRTTRRK